MSFPRTRVTGGLLLLAGAVTLLPLSQLAAQTSMPAQAATAQAASPAPAAAAPPVGLTAAQQTTAANPAMPSPAMPSSAAPDAAATPAIAAGQESAAYVTPDASKGTAPEPVLMSSPMAQLKAFQPDENEEYTLGGGDEINIQVAGRPELSGKYVIGPDGRIGLPTAGTLNLGNMTREQAADAVNKAYGQYFNTISASVSIDRYGSNRVLIVGAVEHPGMMVFDQTPTLLEAVTRAGMQQQVTATGKAATPGQSATDSIPELCTIYRQTPEGQKILSVHLREMLASGNPMADLRLRRNDKIVVTDPREQFVSVLGEVKSPGPVVLTHTSTLPSVLAQAGGLTENAGNNASIAIIDPVTQKPRFVKFKDLLTPAGINEVALKPGEVIFIPKSGLAKLGFFFQQLSPMTSMVSIAALAAVQ